MITQTQKTIVTNLKTLCLAKQWHDLEQYEELLASHLSPYEYAAVQQAYNDWLDRRVDRCIENITLLLNEEI